MSANPYFELGGVSHLALVCSDMKVTTEFYEGKLGMPLVKTMELPLDGGGQHFFFDCGNGDCLAFFWYGRNVPAAPGIAAPTSLASPSADGSMHHVAFTIPFEKIHETARRLDEQGVPYHLGIHQVDTPESLQMKMEQSRQLARSGNAPRRGLDDIDDDTFAVSFYMTDPDGMIVEFCAWAYPGWNKVYREHEPKTVEDHVEPALAR
jgi:catechol 2,3-dioxygenase-like lactoylglutathione lyase family enzyme